MERRSKKNIHSEEEAFIGIPKRPTGRENYFYNQHPFSEIIDAIQYGDIFTLTAEEQRYIALRFGLFDGRQRTLRQTSLRMIEPFYAVRRIEKKVFGKLDKLREQHPEESDPVKRQEVLEELRDRIRLRPVLMNIVDQLGSQI